jgi:hypothetical protein
MATHMRRPPIPCLRSHHLRPCALTLGENREPTYPDGRYFTNDTPWRLPPARMHPWPNPALSSCPTSETV